MLFNYEDVKENEITIGEDKYEITWGRLRRKGKNLMVAIKTKPNDIKIALEVSVPDSKKADELIARMSGKGVWVL